ELGAGRFFSEGEVAHNAAVVVINYALASELSGSRHPLAFVGRVIRVNGRSRRVIGVQSATGFEDRRDPSFVVYAPIRASSALLSTPPRGFAPSIQLRAANLESVDEVRDVAAEWLSLSVPRWQERVRLTVAAEELHEVEQAFGLMKLFVGAL